MHPAEDFRLPPDGQFATSRWRAPFQPVSLLGATLLGTPAVGGLLFGLNYGRMGKPRLLIPSVVAGLLLFGAFLFLIHDGIARYEREIAASIAADPAAYENRNHAAVWVRLPGGSDHPLTILGAYLHFVGVLAAIPVASHQHRMAAVWTASGGGTQEVLWLALPLIVLVQLATRFLLPHLLA